MQADQATGRKTLIVAPLFHVMALQEQFIPCMRMGNTVLMLSALNIQAFLELVEKEKIDYLVGLASHLQDIAGVRKKQKKHDSSSIKIAGFGAAPMSPDLMAKMKKAFANAKFFNGFGLTEASISLARYGPGMYDTADIRRASHPWL